MMQPHLYLAGKRLNLAKRIGKGGEGEVYVLSGEPKKAVKVCTGKRDDNREAKVKAMVRLGMARTSSLVSFPEEIVTSSSGSFAGFSMRLIEGYRPIHELYGVKSRKICYPKADYRFLVRAATNTARAVGQVHASSCVIGDLNHSGILVSDDATVALIDADSFQFQADGKTYPCLVGVPDFTPPELQGIPLNGVVRT
jgi:DNA-binding helix-hairpin-helix protein with protein kinase domain